MVFLTLQLAINSCPHCGRANPTLRRMVDFLTTKDHADKNERWWGVYVCNSCGGLVTAWARRRSNRPKDPRAERIEEVYPSVPTISDAIPQKPRELLRQAQNSLHAPAGAIMLSASAVDAMLKEKGYTEGSLYTRIEKAASEHLITDDMAKWANQIRLDANDQRHADKFATLPTPEDGELVFDFAVSFAEYLFVLPSKVSRGISDSEPPQKPT